MPMRYLPAIVVALVSIMAASPACAQRMAGFADIAAKGNVLELRVPLWMNGTMRAGPALTGRVRRKSLGASEALTLFGISIGGAERFGRFTFEAEGPSVDGKLSGDCIYDRTERRLGIDSFTISEPRRPLLLRCRFLRAGQVVGTLRLEAEAGTGAIAQPAHRIGRVKLGDKTVTIRSEHYLQGARVPTELPVGYRVADADTDEVIGAVDLTDFSRRVIALPTSNSARPVSLVASIALAVFWDPGDTDD